MGKKIRSVSFPPSTLISDPYRHLPIRVTATYGPMEDGESTLCVPLFQIPEEEEDKMEDQQEENEDPEDGYK